jgi:hypothetical protein
MPSATAGESGDAGSNQGRVQQTMLISQLKNWGTSPLPGLLSPYLAAQGCLPGLPVITQPFCC